MDMRKEEEEFLEPALLVNEAAFSCMCEVLRFGERDRRLARCAVVTYELARERHRNGHHH